MTTIRVFTTGGTIDKFYFDAKDQFHIGDPEIERLLLEAHATVEVLVESIMRKDSLDITREDRELIRRRVTDDACQRIIVTHGTDTMAETGRALQDIAGKTIVLTGAMQPARLRVTDAAFNIGCAVMAVQLLPAGVYITMNGRVFDPRTARKNVDRNCFEVVRDAAG